MKEEKSNRTKLVIFRLTPKEYATLEGKRSRTTCRKLSEYLRLLIFNRPVTVIACNGAEGTIYGITYIDHRTKCVFNGSALGKQYSAKGITERCIEDPFSLHQQKSQRIGMDVGHAASAGNACHVGNGSSLENDQSLDSLLSPIKDGYYTPHQLKKPKRKKQKGFSMGF